MQLQIKIKSLSKENFMKFYKLGDLSYCTKLFNIFFENSNMSMHSFIG